MLRDGKGFSVPVTLASAATTDIGAQNALAVEITGTTTITSFGTSYNGPRFLRFTGALTLTHNSTSLNLPGAANITTVAGDTAIAFPNLALNGWNVVQFQRSAGLPAASGANTDITSKGNNTSTIYTTGGTSTAYTITPNPTYSAYAAGMSFVVNFNAASGASPTLAINGIATPPNLVKENADGTYSNIAANEILANHRSRVTLISTTQALVERVGPRAGDVLQVVTFANDAGSSTTSGVLANLSAGAKSFTPKSTNSLIFVKAFFTGQSGLLGGVNTVAYFQVMESGSAAGVVSYIENATASGGNRPTAPIVAVARLANAALTSRSFTLGGYTSNVSSPASATNQVFEITEIQA